MRFWVGVTDKNWFEFLRARAPDEVNFWQPSGRPVASFLEAGTPFLFKLHAPNNFIVGGGFFVRFSTLPARLAWEAFGEKNGATDYDSLRKRVQQYRQETIRGDPEIGCNVLNGPFFFAERDWLPVPDSWAPNIVRGRTFDTAEADGARLWDAATERLHIGVTPRAAATEPRFGVDYLTRARLGQGAFRVLVTEAYARRCAVTGERTLPVLEAAHIRPYADEGPHLVANGLLLREDLHTLFDRGYLTITEDLRVVVSKRIKEEFTNGREYYRYDNQSLASLPAAPDDLPSTEFIRWHNEHVYLE
jgi:putative restriction endonuclease